MLRGLDISNMLIIDRLELDFQPGLNVLTGETGAGKSILLDALGFVLGWRGRADLVRQGAAQGEVTAWFDLPPGHPAHAVLEEAGLPGGDELILRRVNTAEGRKTAWINDRRASGEALRALSDVLVELHGQHDDRGLLNPRGHRDILDTYADAAPERDAVRGAWRALQAARKTLADAQAQMDAIRAEEDFLRHAAAELDALSPEPGEEETLDTRRRLMQAAEKIRTDVVKAYDALGYDGAEGALGNAMRWLEGAADKAEGALDAPISALGRALAELDEAQQGVVAAIDGLSFNPHELEETEERLFALRALARKHEVPPDDLATLAATLRGKLEALDAGDADLARRAADVQKAEADYDKAAKALHKVRADAAQRLDAAVSAELAPLKMERATFTTILTGDTPGEAGTDAVAFTVATNPGAPSGPLGKIASGGELSRFLLALKVCLAQGQSGLTMIFDEIDRGVGGATADAVGRRLKSLAENGQVLVVTHSPQVAALGGSHMRVEKRVTDGMTTSTVVPLDAPDRIDEVARMLSGDSITEAAREAARALLAG
ncbi:MAG: DNA repair protein RecN [Pseudomonadota bacterium]